MIREMTVPAVVLDDGFLKVYRNADLDLGIKFLALELGHVEYKRTAILHSSNTELH